jgi:hypothetical protein
MAAGTQPDPAAKYPRTNTNPCLISSPWSLRDKSRPAFL